MMQAIVKSAGSGSRQLHKLSATRCMSSYMLDSFSGGGGLGAWPIRKTNTIFNIVPQGHKHVVERFGKLHNVYDSGWFLAIPLVDSISYVVDVRERAMEIPGQSAITRDNVSVEVSGNLFVRFMDATKAAYGAENPLYSVTQVSFREIHPSIEHSLTPIILARPVGNAICDRRDGTGRNIAWAGSTELSH